MLQRPIYEGTSESVEGRHASRSLGSDPKAATFECRRKCGFVCGAETRTPVCAVGRRRSRTLVFVGTASRPWWSPCIGLRWFLSRRNCNARLTHNPRFIIVTCVNIHPLKVETRVRTPLGLPVIREAHAGRISLLAADSLPLTPSSSSGWCA